MRYTEFLADVKQMPQRAKMTASGWTDDFCCDVNEVETWSGVDSFEEAFDLCTYGDKASVTELKRKIAEAQPETIKSFEHSIFGNRLDVDRYIQGNPQCLKRRVQQKPQGRKIWLNVNISASFNIEGEQLQKYAARLVNVINHLSKSGDEIKLTASYKAKYTKRGAITEAHFVIKDYQDRLILNDINAIFQPYFLRRIMFKYLEQYKALKSTYGTPIDAPIEGAINLPMFQNWLNKKPVDQWTKLILDRIEKELVNS